MAVFAILSDPSNEKLPEAIQEQFPSDSLRIRAGQWLVAASGITAQGLSEQLGITDGKNGAAVVITSASYFGRATPSIWEWIKAKLETSNG